MDMHAEHHYPADPATVFAMLTDADFLRAKLESLGSTDIDLQVTPGDRTTVRSSRTVEVAVPGFARRVVSPRNTLVQTDEWDAPGGDATRAGRWRVETKGVPLSMDGTYHLAGDPDGTVVVIDGHLKVSVPLIGGRLEKFAREQAEEQLSAEHQFGVHWLTEKH